jgi:predicted DNA binding CopG/RHH family protein
MCYVKVKDIRMKHRKKNRKEASMTIRWPEDVLVKLRFKAKSKGISLAKLIRLSVYSKHPAIVKTHEFS